MASELGYVSGVSNGGQSNPKGPQDLQWLLNGDGSWNLEGWKNANWQATHILSVKSKEIATAYYGKAAHHSYLFGCSTGGRAVHKAIQEFPGDYDGFLSACPSIGQSHLFLSLGHPFIVINNHLHEKYGFTDIQQEIVVQRAIEFGDTQITGSHDGYFSTLENNYDPREDLSLLSVEEGGYCTQAWAFTKRQLEAINMIWYGPTLNGSFVDPSLSTGTDPNRPSSQLWWGKIRGVSLAFVMSKREIVGNYLAVVFKDTSLAPENWNHALGNGTSAWEKWSYERYAEAMLDAQRLDKEIFHMDSDDPDLRVAKQAGVKMITYHALADPGVAPQNTISYYHKVADFVGGVDELDDFYRLFLVPGQDHCVRGPGVAGSANPPIPTVEEWLDLLVTWVENGEAPDHIVAHSVDNTATRPICKYPKIPRYDGHGRVDEASSFTCEVSGN
jgi:feruloyl esterase